MKIFKEILEEQNKESLLSYLKNHSIYSVMENSIDYIMEQLKSIESVSTGAKLKLEWDDFNDVWDIVMEQEGEIYSISWVPWEEALGHLVDEEEVLKKVSTEEFVSMILYDLTFYGVDYKKREANIVEIIGRIED